ncbi:MAG: hypothetical protein AAB518_01760 [Patescibacteria group bacterium]
MKKNIPHFPVPISQSGFSLVEALVVISITIILTSILVVHSRTSERQILFFREQSVLISALLRAKSFSIQTFQPELQPGLPSPSTADRVCGWGVHFDRSDPLAPVIVFSDLAPGGGNSNCTSANKMYSQGQNEKFETIVFDSSIIIECVDVVAPGQLCASNANKLDITFKPPDPEVFFFVDSAPRTGEAVVVLKLNDPNQPRTATIRVSEIGQVSVTNP